jgi:hypothetical protein
MKTRFREIQSALYATHIYLHGLFTNQHVNWLDVFEKRMAFYEIFDNWD